MLPRKRPALLRCAGPKDKRLECNPESPRLESIGPTNRVLQTADSLPSPASTSAAACRGMALLASKEPAIRRAPASRAESPHIGPRPVRRDRKTGTDTTARPTRLPGLAATPSRLRIAVFFGQEKAPGSIEKMDKKAASGQPWGSE